MTDQRAGRFHNYSRVPGLLGEGLLNWKASADELWNAAAPARDEAGGEPPTGDSQVSSRAGTCSCRAKSV